MPSLTQKLDFQDYYSKKTVALAKKVEVDPKIIDDDLLSEFDMTLASEVESDAEIIAALEAIAPPAKRSNKVTEPETKWSNKVTDTAKPLSNKVTKRPRRMDKRDLQTIKATQQIAPAQTAAIDRPLVDVWFNPLPTYLKPSNDNVQLPVWEHCGDRVKLTFANRALVESGRRSDVAAFSLNLTPKRIEAAQRHPKGFVDSLKRDLDRTFNRMIGEIPGYWFAAGATSDGRLHIHGAIHISKSSHPTVRDALLAIGGDWPDGNGSDYQLDLRPMTDADGWVRYVLKQGPGARRLIITGKSLTIPKELRRLARALYVDTRAA